MSFNEENIEAYLTGKSTAADKFAMEEAMKNDPMLRSEVNLQKDIIESLKSNRKIQLKNRLNNIDVSATTGVSSAVKIAASFITVGMIGAGIYYMSVFSAKDKDVENVSIQVNKTSANTSSQKTEKDVNGIAASGVIEKAKATNNKNSNKNDNTNQVSSETAINPLVNAPDGNIAEQEVSINRDNITIPNGLNNTEVKKADNITSEYDASIKKDLSYKFFSGRLYLSKDFEEQPYTLIELNASKSKQFYLFFGGNYYELKSNQTKPTRLNEVKDVIILAKLKTLEIKK